MGPKRRGFLIGHVRFNGSFEGPEKVSLFTPFWGGAESALFSQQYKKVLFALRQKKGEYSPPPVFDRAKVRTDLCVLLVFFFHCIKAREKFKNIQLC